MKKSITDEQVLISFISLYRYTRIGASDEMARLRQTCQYFAVKETVNNRVNDLEKHLDTIQNYLEQIK